MAKQRCDLRILLMQIRDEHQVRMEEHQSFAQYSQLHPAQLDCLNVFDTPSFPATQVEGYDALFVGGASEASVLEPETYSFLGYSQAMLRYCLDQHIPVFASCFGFQLAVIALGGTIIRDEKDFEMGSIPIQLTPAAQTDPLFGDLLQDQLQDQKEFRAIAVHRERALSLPSECDLLAYTSACCHAFRVRGKPFWAFQFHPEVDKPTLVKRLTLYQSKYTQNSNHLDAVLQAATDTPEANRLLEKFVTRLLTQTYPEPFSQQPASPPCPSSLFLL